MLGELKASRIKFFKTVNVIFRLSQKDSKKLDLINCSNMSCNFSKFIGVGAKHNQIDMLRIDIGGHLAKLPSVSRGKLLSTKKGFDKKTGVQKVIPTTRTNPEYQIIIEALTSLFFRNFPRSTPCFYDNAEHRVFGLFLLSDSCGSMDSHNLNKFTADWMQALGVLRNDKFLDCFARHKKHVPPDSFEPLDLSTTTIILTLDRFILPELSSMFRRVKLISETNVSH